MDLSLFKLDRSPFDSTPDPSHFVNLATAREAVETLKYAIDNRKGVVVVTGPPGTGKTAVARMLRYHLGARAAVATIARPCANRDDLWAAIAEGFRISRKHTAATVSLAQEIERFADQLHEQDIPAVVVVENAHDLPDDCLDLIRQLAAMEADDMPLVQLVVIGWPKLAARFLGLAGAALQQRMYRHIEIAPLSESDTAAYIRGRIHNAGGTADEIFTEDAIAVVHRRTGGIPRLINGVCEALLAHATGLKVSRIDAELAETVPFEGGYDPKVFEAQLADDEAGVLFNARLQEHPTIRDLADRLAGLEAGLSQGNADIKELRDAQPAVTRQLRRYDRICERVLAMLRSMQQYRQEAETTLGACRQALEQMQQMLAVPQSILHEATRLAGDLREMHESTRAAVDEARTMREALARQTAACEQASRHLAEERNDTLPVMNRTKRMINLLRKVHHVTHEQCQKLDSFRQRAQELCDSIPGRLARLEDAMAEPVRTMEQLRLADHILRKRIEAGQQQTAHMEKIMGQAVHRARSIRAEIERTRDEEWAAPGDLERAAADRRTPASPGHETEPDELDAHSLTRRVQELRDLVKTLRHAAEPAVSGAGRH